MEPDLVTEMKYVQTGPIPSLPTQWNYKVFYEAMLTPGCQEFGILVGFQTNTFLLLSGAGTQIQSFRHVRQVLFYWVISPDPHAAESFSDFLRFER